MCPIGFNSRPDAGKCNILWRTAVVSVTENDHIVSFADDITKGIYNWRLYHEYKN